MSRLKVTLFFVLTYFSALAISAERNLVLDPIKMGPYAVGSMNWTIDKEKENSLSGGITPGEYQQGFNDDGELLYINELLKYPEDAFTFNLSVPDDKLYGASRGQSLPYGGYVLYPTSDDNTREDYEVFDVAPALPRMQDAGDKPLFADPNEKYPLLMYSHGAGGHPTARTLEELIVLASHGYIIVALYHGDNRFETQEARRFSLRPLAVKTALDTILDHEDFKDHINKDQIGGMGQSYGGATMMALLGAKVFLFEVSVLSVVNTTVDSRIKAASTIVPYMGKDTYDKFGSNGVGAKTIDRPIMGHAANMDETADYSKQVTGFEAIPGTKYLIEYDKEMHDPSPGALNDAYTWSLVFLDAFVKDDAGQADVLSRLESVSDSGVDELVLVNEPKTEEEETDTEEDQGNSGSDNNQSDPSPNEASLRGVMSSKGASKAKFKAGAFLDNKGAAKTSLSAGDNVTISATVIPEEDDVGQAGNLYVVMQSKTEDGTSLVQKNEDGLFEKWNGGLKKLKPYISRASLGSSEKLEVFEGTLQAGTHKIFVGYSTQDGTLHFNSVAYRINVE